jgi:hypothetical protein
MRIRHVRQDVAQLLVFLDVHIQESKPADDPGSLFLAYATLARGRWRLRREVNLHLGQHQTLEKDAVVGRSKTEKPVRERSWTSRWILSPDRGWRHVIYAEGFIRCRKLRFGLVRVRGTDSGRAVRTISRERTPDVCRMHRQELE